MQNRPLFEHLESLDENDWFCNPLKWNVAQWYFIGTLLSDLSICSGSYAKRWGSQLKVLNSNAEYLICGNKDELILFCEYLCKNNKLPLNDYIIFKVLGNKTYNKVNEVNLEECDFKGTRESEIHFHIFIELKNEFIQLLLKYGFLFDNNPDIAGVYEKHIPIEIIQKLSDESKESLFAGLFDGDGSVGAVVKCSKCSKSKTLRKTLYCPNCNADLSKDIRSLDYYIVLDSRSSLLDEQIIFLKEILGLKGHLYLHLIKKEYPTKDPSTFEAKIKKWEEKVERLGKLEKKYSLPLIFHENILKKELPSFEYAPDISGSMRFRFSPYYRKKMERIKWYGIEDLYQNNLPILLKSSKYMIVEKKINLILQVSENKGIN